MSDLLIPVIFFAAILVPTVVGLGRSARATAEEGTRPDPFEVL